MEETRELTSERIDRPRARSEEADTGDSRILEIPRFLSNSRLGLHGLGHAVLEWSLDLLGFERGFLLGETRGAGGASGETEDAFCVLASRVRRQEASHACWRDVRNPEYALNRSVVLRVFAASGPVTVDDCLIQAEGSAAGKQRCVLAQSFTLVPGLRGALYLDRGLGMEGIDISERERFSCLVEGCAPALGRAYLAREVEDLRETVARLEASRDSSDEESRPDRDDSADEPFAFDAAVPPGGPFPNFHGIVGRDEKLHKVFRIIDKVKDSDLNVYIFGESGTGKELIARAMHEASQRRDKRFVSENCGAIAENLLESELFGHVKGAFTGADEDKQGLFELADEGTLFIDEIGDMSEGMQRKLLRALQEGTIRPVGAKKSIKVNVRVICASNRDLKHLVKEGTFRADLYYRLNVIQIRVPPLRERRGDIGLLTDYFTLLTYEEEGIKKRFGESAMKALRQYSWPGNVRELRNLIRRLFLTCSRRVIARKDVMPYLSSEQATACLGENLERDDTQLVLRIPLRQRFNDIIDECERLVLLNALKENGWNKSRVTKVLGIPRQSLYNKIAKFSLEERSPSSDAPPGRD